MVRIDPIKELKKQQSYLNLEIGRVCTLYESLQKMYIKLEEENKALKQFKKTFYEMIDNNIELLDMTHNKYGPEEFKKLKEMSKKW